MFASLLRMFASRLRSSACTQRQLESDAFQRWMGPLGERAGLLQRKAWEWAYIAQALDERGMLRPGRRGLGFAVGTEPLSALFAQRGCEILATDLDASDAGSADWANTNQHADGLAAMNRRGICPPDEFAARVKFRPVDMREMPDDLGEFDFIWSSCSLEHLGNLRRGNQFLLDMTRFLRPGGVAVHTTEFNVSSEVDTVFEGGAVIYRRKDLKAIKATLEAVGCSVEPLDFTLGNQPADQYVDVHPYKSDVHLRLELFGFVATSFGIILTKNRTGASPDAPSVARMLDAAYSPPSDEPQHPVRKRHWTREAVRKVSRPVESLARGVRRLMGGRKSAAAGPTSTAD